MAGANGANGTNGHASLDVVEKLRAAWMRSFASDVTDEELVKFEELQAAHPEWVPDREIPDVPPVLPATLGPPEIAVSVPRQQASFTQADLEHIAGAQKCSVAGLKQRWIIQRGTNFYVIGLEGEYRPPISKGELAVSLPRDLARVPSVSGVADVPAGWIDWNKRVGESLRPKSVDELLSDYATVARTTVASMSIPRSFYVPETEEFHERVCPLRKIEPVHSPEIHRWLVLLGGEKLLDWVATSTYTNAPTCALYLHGERDAGKNMLATGLARQWSQAPTEIAAAAASFNSAIAECPLIFADEEMPKTVTTGFLRHFIGGSRHALRRKGLPEASLHGSFRVLLASNNPDMLKNNEEASREDIAAIAGRVLYINCGAEAVAYLESLGGRAYTEAEGWVDGDKIAAHALWLRDNRSVVRGRRFWVEAHGDEMQRRLASQGSIRDLVVEWVCKAMLEKGWVGPVGIHFGGGHVYVNASFVKNNWERLLGDNRPPSLSRIGRILRPLALPDPEFKNKIERRMAFGDGRADFYNIDPQHVLDAAQAMQIGTPEKFRKLIGAHKAYMDLVGDEEEKPPTGLFAVPGIPEIPPVPSSASST